MLGVMESDLSKVTPGSAFGHLVENGDVSKVLGPRIYQQGARPGDIRRSQGFGGLTPLFLPASNPYVLVWISFCYVDCSSGASLILFLQKGFTGLRTLYWS